MKFSLLAFIAKILVAASMVALLPASLARAEPVPLPKIDFKATAKLLNEGTLFIRHSGGRMRIELRMPQFKEPAIGFIDLNRKVMVMILPIPGVKNTAMEVEFGDDAIFGQILGDGQRAGEATVAGERCFIWKIAGNDENRAAACLTHDNIALRTQVSIEGKTRTVFEVTGLKRQRQNPAELEVPADASIVKLPKGMKGIPGFPLQ
jgi:hypothetical protein